MKLLFIEAKSNLDVMPAVKLALKLLPRRVGLVTTAQHEHKLKEAAEFLGKNNIKAIICGAVLGCNVSAAEKAKDKVDAFLYIGSGEFHPLGVALATSKKVIVANPASGNAGVIKQEDIERFRKRRKGALLRFLSAKNIGILVSTKQGQEELEKALELENRLKDKKCYIFAADMINFKEFENFPFIECWVNTACLRIIDERSDVINADELLL